MTPNDEAEPAVGAGDQGAPSWRARAVERSLERPRAAAEARSAEFVKTALELVEDRGGEDFTIQDVVEKMRVSTRTFYQYFSGKDALLVAMFEEVQGRQNREFRNKAADEPDPLARLEFFVLNTLRRATGTGRRFVVGRMLVQSFLRLQAVHPEELRQSYGGVRVYLEDLIAEAADAGLVRVDDPKRSAGILLQVVTGATQASILGSPFMDGPATPEEVWHFCLAGLGAARVAAEKPMPSGRHDQE